MDKYSIILNRINEMNLHIDSLYIEENQVLHKLIDNDNLHELRSCSKLLVAMAIGIAIDDNIFELDENIYNYLKKYIKNEKNIDKIKQWNIRTLLTHTTGYNKMLMSNKEIIENNLDKAELLDYVLSTDIINEPNTTYVYNNVEPFLISVLFKEKHNINLIEYIDENIFKKIDICNYKWDNYGEYCPGCTGLYLFANDFYKLGKLLLDNGKYKNKQVIPSEWINQMCKMQIETPHLIKPEKLFPKIGAGYFTFISRDNYIFRDGTNGQYIILNKDKKILICIMASEKQMSKVTEIFRDIF